MKGGSNKLISSEELAEDLGVNVETVYRQWKSWGLKGYRVGRQLRFRERDIESWLESKAA